MGKGETRKGQYVWRDDLKNRIKDALNSPESVSDETFTMELGKRGVDTRKRGKGYSFAFTMKMARKEALEVGARKRL